MEIRIPLIAMMEYFKINARSYLFLLMLILFYSNQSTAQKKPRFNVVVLSENSGWHVDYSKEAKKWLNQLATDSSFQIKYIENTDSINDTFLNRFQLFIQLDYPPYGWKPAAEQAFIKYIEEGRGGWIGFHHATLLGEFDGHKMWNWFSEFMGGIRYQNYIASFASADVILENLDHPVLKGIPHSFTIEREEWYTYDKSPRPNVRVLATVDEKTYKPDSDIKMNGDHPVIWINPSVKAKNIYMFMGHSPLLFNNINYTRLFKNSIFWAAQK